MRSHFRLGAVVHGRHACVQFHACLGLAIAGAAVARNMATAPDADYDSGIVRCESTNGRTRECAADTPVAACDWCAQLSQAPLHRRPDLGLRPWRHLGIAGLPRRIRHRLWSVLRWRLERRRECAGAALRIHRRPQPAMPRSMPRGGVRLVRQLSRRTLHRRPHLGRRSRRRLGRPGLPRRVRDRLSRQPRLGPGPVRGNDRYGRATAAPAAPALRIQRWP